MPSQIQWITICLMLCLGILFLFTRNQGRKHREIRLLNQLDALRQDVLRLRELGNLVDNAVGIITFDADDSVFSANSIFCAIRRIAQESLLGCRIKDSLGIIDHDILTNVQAHLAKGAIWKGEFQGQREDKSLFWCYAVFYPQRWEQGRYAGCMALVIDTTEIKEAQMLLQRNFHLTALGEMAGSIAHEINNPVSVISLHTDVMLKKHDRNLLDSRETRAGLEKIASTIRRISKILDTMRHLSRIEADVAEPQQENIQPILEQALDFVRERAKRHGIAIHIHDRACHPITILNQGFGIQQILINLLGNAVDALEALANEPRYIDIDLSCDRIHRLVEIKVSNSGPLIPRRLAEHIMQPFFTTKPIGKGNGLGLSISNKIAESHGGKLYLDQDFLLTTFVLQLPMQDAHGTGNLLRTVSGR